MRLGEDLGPSSERGISTQSRNAASRSRMQNCPQITQIDADEEFFEQEHTEATEMEKAVFLCALCALLFNPFSTAARMKRINSLQSQASSKNDDIVILTSLWVHSGRVAYAAGHN
jgi:hypothetical protein